MTRLVVNGEIEDLEVANLLDLLEARAVDLARRGVAVALNGAVVPRGQWRETRLRPDDRVEIVKPFAGG